MPDPINLPQNHAGFALFVTAPAAASGQPAAAAPEAQVLIDQLRSDLSLMDELARVPNTTLEEQARYKDATETINREYNQGMALPQGVRALREMVSGEALNELDAAILDVIRERHAVGSQDLVGNEAIAEALAAAARAAAGAGGDAKQRLENALKEFGRGITLTNLSRDLASVDLVALISGNPADAHGTLMRSLKDSTLRNYLAHRQGIEATGDQAVLQSFDQELLKDLLGKANTLAYVRSQVPDMSPWVDRPNGGNHLPTRDQQGRVSDTDILLGYLEDKNTGDFMERRARAYEKGQEAGQVFDTTALEGLRKLSQRMPSKEQREFVPADLYPIGGRPRPTDIEQDAMGNCYLLASVGALAKAHPEIIQNAIRYDEATKTFYVKAFDKDGNALPEIPVTQEELRQNVNGEAEYDEIIYKLDEKGNRVKDENGKPIVERVERVTTSGGSRADDDRQGDGAIWPAVLEVAWVKSKDSNWNDGLLEGYTAASNGANPGAVLRFFAPTDQVERVESKDPDVVAKVVELIRRGNGITIGIDTVPDPATKEGKALAAMLNGLGAPGNHAQTVLNAWQDEHGEVYVELLNPWGGDSAESGESAGMRSVVSLTALKEAGVPFYFHAVSSTTKAAENDISAMLRGIPEGRLNTHRTAGNEGEPKSLRQSIDTHTTAGATNFTAVVDDVYTTRGAASGNLLPVELQNKRAELRERIAAGDERAAAELNFLDQEICWWAQQEEGRFPARTRLEPQAYVDMRRAEIEGLDLSLIPAERIQAAMDFALQNPGAPATEILKRIYADAQGVVQRTGDPAIDAQIDALAGLVTVWAAECVAPWGTDIGRDGANPAGDLGAGLVAMDELAAAALAKLGIGA